jgi:hypothetical protein
MKAKVEDCSGIAGNIDTGLFEVWGQIDEQWMLVARFYYSNYAFAKASAAAFAHALVTVLDLIDL